MTDDFRTSLRRVCLVCQTKDSKYICPTCNIPYCSSVCYKNHDITCTETFYKKHVLAEVSLSDKGGKRDTVHGTNEQSQARQQFLSSLVTSSTQADHPFDKVPVDSRTEIIEEDTVDTELVDEYRPILQQLYDLTVRDETNPSLSTSSTLIDASLSRLPLPLQQKFYRSIQNGELTNKLGLNEWKPWYTVPIPQHKLEITNTLQNIPCATTMNLLSSRSTVRSSIHSSLHHQPCYEYLLPLSRHAPVPLDFESRSVPSSSSTVTFATLISTLLPTGTTVSSLTRPVPLSSYLHQKSPSPLLPYHLLNVLITYCHLIRLYVGAWIDHEVDVAVAFLDICMVFNPQHITTIGSTLTNVSTTCTLSLESIMNTKPSYRLSTLPSLYYGLELLNDVCSIMKEPHYIVDALVHILYVFEESIGTLNSKSFTSTANDVRNKHYYNISNKELRNHIDMMLRKTSFFTSWAYHIFIHPDQDMSEFDRIDQQIPSGKFTANQLTNEIYEILHERILFLQESERVQRKTVESFSNDGPKTVNIIEEITNMDERHSPTETKPNELQLKVLTKDIPVDEGINTVIKVNEPTMIESDTTITKKVEEKLSPDTLTNNVVETVSVTDSPNSVSESFKDLKNRRQRRTATSSVSNV